MATRHEFEVVCLGGGAAGEAIATGFADSGLKLIPSPGFGGVLGCSRVGQSHFEMLAVSLSKQRNHALSQRKEVTIKSRPLPDRVCVLDFRIGNERVSPSFGIKSRKPSFEQISNCAQRRCEPVH